MWLWANDIINAWEGVPNGTLLMMFTCCPNLIFLASKWLETEISNWSFCYFEKFKADIHLANFEQVKTVTICFFFTNCGQVTVTLLSLYKTCGGKQSKPSPFDKNSRTTHRIWRKLFSMIQLLEIKNWFPLSINRLYMFNLLFLSVTPSF